MRKILWFCCVSVSLQACEAGMTPKKTALGENQRLVTESAVDESGLAQFLRGHGIEVPKGKKLEDLLCVSSDRKMSEEERARDIMRFFLSQDPFDKAKVSLYIALFDQLEESAKNYGIGKTEDQIRTRDYLQHIADNQASGSKK